VDLARLAHDQTVNRIVMGAGLIALPQVFGRVWMGSQARDERHRVVARALGARDLSLGVAGLLALREQDRTWAARAFAAQAFADAVDLAAMLAAGRRLPLSARLVGGVLATSSAAVAAAYARRVAP
jgi:hypothetical protein